MSRYLLLDSGPLGIVTQPRISAEVVAVNHWLIDCLSSGDAVLVPAIVYYELRRELLRARKSSGLARLDAFVQIDSNRYLALSDEALRLAAELWAQARQQGHPTSSALDLDIVVILAAQALALGVGAEVIVVTTNPRHLRQFVDARLWNDVSA
ncbi:MAG: nuclease [Bryobacteraceae bacterium]